MSTAENTTLSNNDAHHTNLKLINSEVPTTTQLPYIQLAFQVSSPKTFGWHLM